MRQPDPSVRRCRYCDKPLLESSLLRRKFCDPVCRYRNSIVESALKDWRNRPPVARREK